jgi:hypothetical protein
VIAEPDGSPVSSAAQVWRGKAYPLGATYDGSGTNFALFSETAERGAHYGFWPIGARWVGVSASWAW